MKNFEIPLDYRADEVEVYLAYPNGKLISKLKHIYNRKLTLKQHDSNEFSFDMPYQIERKHELESNPHIYIIKHHFLLKVKYGEVEEWFIIINENPRGLNNVKSFTAYSLQYEMSNNNIRTWAGVLIDGKYRKTSLNGRQVIEELLTPTLWKIGHMDARYETEAREFDFTSTTVLEALYEVAETFDMLFVFDTLKREINIYDPKQYGVNKGLLITKNKYMKDIGVDSKADEMVTRLKLFGKDGLTINRISPSGVNYIEDFSYFTHPFERDENRNVIQHSAFGMSDELCHAILDFKEFVSSKEGVFKSKTEESKELSKQNDTLTNQLITLMTEMGILEDKLTVAQSQKEDTTQIKADIDKKQIEIDNKTAELNTLETQRETLKNEITELRNSMQRGNFFSKELERELVFYTFEKEYENEHITDEQTLLDAGIEAFIDMRKPKETISISLVNFMRSVESYKDWGKLSLGCKFYLHYPTFEISSEVQVTEMSLDFDTNGISITISNTRNLKTDEDVIVEKIKKGASASTQLDLNKDKWDLASDKSNSVAELLEGKWDATKNEIVAGVNENVVIDRRGITITDPTDPMRLIRIMHGVVGMSSDGGATFKLAINPDGVFAENLVGRIIAGQNLYIENETGKFRFDKDGVTIEGASLKILGADDANLVDKWNQGVTEGENYNGVILSTEEGLVVIRDDAKVKTTLNATEGIKIEQYINGQWEKKLFADTDGNLTVEDLIANRVRIKNGDITLIDGVTKTLNLDAFTTVFGKLTADNINVDTITIRNANITGTLTHDKLNLNENLKGVEVKNDAGETTYKVDSNGQVAVNASITVGGNNNNGRIVVLNANNEIIGDLDANKGGFEKLYVADLQSPTVTQYSANDLNFYVSDRILPSYGSVENPAVAPDDTNAGTGWRVPLSTIGEAVRRIPRHYDGTANIYIESASSLSENLEIRGYVGAGRIEIKSSTTTRKPVWVGSIKAFNISLKLEFEYLDLYANNAIGAGQGIAEFTSCTHATLFNCNLQGTSTTEYGVVSKYNSAVEVEKCDFQSVDRGLVSFRMAKMLNVNNTGKPRISGAYADAGEVYLQGTMPHGQNFDYDEINGGRVLGTKETVDGTGTTVTPPAAVREITTTWTANAGDGWRPQFSGSWIGQPTQGGYGSYGVYKGYWFFGSGLGNTLAGKTIKRIRFYCGRSSYAGDGTGVGIYFRPHGYTSKPSGTPIYWGSNWYRVPFNRGEAKWITLPSSFHTDFQNGAKGIGIWIDSFSNYAKMETPAKIEVTYV
ncbi:phage tail protein [Priestia endophytica]